MKKIIYVLHCLTLVISLNIFCSTALAQDSKTTSQDKLTPQEQKIDATVKAMIAVAEEGPKDIILGKQGTLKLPAGFFFIPKKESVDYLRADGNQVDEENFYGLVMSKKMAGFVSIDFSPAGYIKDDDAKNWDTAKLLTNLKKGTEEGNAERLKQGIPAWEVMGWIQPPKYDATAHRLVWSISMRDKGTNEPDDQMTVNYNTYLLGREGYFSLDLVTDLASVEAEKPLANQLLNSLSFDKSKGYNDFNSSTDKIAKYGLAALVGGLVVKKAGILAGLAFFFLKMWKLTAIGLVAVGAAIKKMVSRKNK